MPENKYNINNSSKKESKYALYMPSMFVRFLNCIIDSIVIVIIALYIGSFLGFDYRSYAQNIDEVNTQLQSIALVTSLLYYTILEASFGKTLGKVITKTKVVNIYGEKPKLGKIILRSLVRLIPFAALVIFFTNSRTLHDILSKTYVIVDE